jgi:ribosomal protein L20
MNAPNTYITREQLAQELGLSYSTFWRKIKKAGIKIESGLLAPCVQQEIKLILGFVL